VLSGAGLTAFAAGACAVLGAWEALAAVDGRAPARVLERWLAPLRAGRPPTPAERRRLALVGTGTLCAGGWLVAGPVAALGLGAAGPLAVRQAIAWRAARRRAELARAAPAVARAVADALAGGHSIRGALAAAAEADLGGAVGDELDRAARALGLGEPNEAVLEDLRRRAGDPGWDTLVAATMLQARAGGDLAALLRALAARLEEARRSDAEARSATAQARFTAWIVVVLPAAAAVLAELGSPGFLAGLASAPLTGALVAASVVLQAGAAVAVRRICRPGP
jgi:tight adherence protein B